MRRDNRESILTLLPLLSQVPLSVYIAILGIRLYSLAALQPYLVSVVGGLKA